MDDKQQLHKESRKVRIPRSFTKTLAGQQANGEPWQQYIGMQKTCTLVEEWSKRHSAWIEQRYEYDHSGNYIRTTRFHVTASTKAAKEEMVKIQDYIARPSLTRSRAFLEKRGYSKTALNEVTRRR